MKLSIEISVDFEYNHIIRYFGYFQFKSRGKVKEMASGKKGKSGGILEKVAAFIVDKRKAIYLVYIIMLIFCVVASNWVKVNNTLTDYTFGGYRNASGAFHNG